MEWFLSHNNAVVSYILKMLVPMTLFLTLCNTSNASRSILDVELARVRPENNGPKTILYYKDIPADSRETVSLECRVPKADSYEWQVDAKLGSPFAGGVHLGKPLNSDESTPWTITLSELEYPWEALLVKCIPKFLHKKLVTLVWVIMKLKSSSETPYHPSLCLVPGAMCVSAMYDCVNGNGEDYRGTYNYTESGKMCQPWNSYVPHIHSNLYRPALVDPSTKRHFFNQQDEENLEAIGNHNYCRNYYSKLAPYCLAVSDVRETSHTLSHYYEYCAVKPCADCMYGKGDGAYPGLGRNAVWDPPVYKGSTDMTVAVVLNDKDQKVHARCHRGVSAWWGENKCRFTNVVNNRRADDATTPQCLIVREEELKNKPYPENVHWSGYVWSRCTAPQCTLRQVWFALVNTDGYIHLDENNGEFVQIPILVGSERCIQFHHFGTTRCTGWRVEGETKVALYVKYFRVECKMITEISSIIISEPTNYFQGRYTLRYVFPEGDRLIESVEYKVNFELVVRIPTSITVQPVVICPGYRSIARAQVHGSYSVISNTVQWFYTRDNVTWYDASDRPDVFESTLDNLYLKISGINKDVYLKVKAKSPSGDVETTQKVTVRAPPFYVLEESTVYGTPGESLTLRIIIKSDCVANWIFGAVVIDENNSKYDISSQYDEDGTITAELTVFELEEASTGIYTVEVSDGVCKATTSVYVSLK